MPENKMSIYDMLQERDYLNEKISKYFDIQTHLPLEDMINYFWKIDGNTVYFSMKKDYVEEYGEEIRHPHGIVRKEDAVAVPIRDSFGEYAWFVLDPKKEVDSD